MKVKDYFRYLWLPLVIIVAVFVLDLVTKHIVSTTMELYHTKVIIPNFLEFYYTLNNGAAFSMLRGQMVFFIVMSIMAMLMLGIYLAYGADKSRPILKIAIALLLGGAAGNFFDRVAFGQVRDFIHIIYFGWDLPLLGTHFPGIFNIADMGVVVGTILFIIAVIIGDKAVPTTEEMADDIQIEHELDGNAITVAAETDGSAIIAAAETDGNAMAAAAELDGLPPDGNDMPLNDSAAPQ